MSAVLDLIKSLRNDLGKIWEVAVEDYDFTTADRRLERWADRAMREVSKAVSAQEGQRVKDAELQSWSMHDTLGNLDRQVRAYDAVLLTLAEEIERDPTFFADEQVRLNAERTGSFSSARGEHSRDPTKIFIVHGHDDANTLLLEKMLEKRLRLQPITMRQGAGRGRTLIEKFEQMAESCSFAFVLLTPDDQITGSAGEYLQARPNVVFELGWFHGRLGRERVVMLLKEGTRIHSDLDGVSRIQFMRSVEETFLQIETELKDAGLVG